MADSLRLKGAKHVIKHTGDEMKLRRPKRGGDVHMVPTWWALKKTVTYTGAAIFDVNSTVGPLALIVPVDLEGTDLGIKHNGDGTFLFPHKRGVDRVAVMSADLKTFYVEYQFSKISGGPTLKRTVNALPTPSAPVSFNGQTSISGTATVGQTLTATAPTYTGGIGTVSTNLIFQKSSSGSGGWSFLAGNPGTAGGASATYTITGAEAGNYIRASFQVTDNDGVESSNSSASGPIADTFANQASAATFTYVVNVNNVGTAELPQNVYTLNGVDGPGIAGSAGDSFLFDFSAVSANHPLAIFTDSSKTTPVTVGVTVEGDQLLFQPPIAGTFSYQCINHANMGGTITVS